MAAPEEPPIIIIGAGPCGLGAAYRLRELGVTNFLLLERGDTVGGLSYTHTDAAGFLWDLGGHVIFSHYEYFDRALDEALGGGAAAWCHHQRESWVWMRERFIPYPLQNNIHRLPPPDLQKCLDGLVDITRTPIASVGSFADWVQQKFGPGLADVFMTPYNEKVWGVPLSTMSYEWMGERVSTVDLKRVLGNLVHGRDEKSWGPNATFRFPARGGTGAIWAGMASRVLPQERLRLGAKVVSVNSQGRTLTLASGETLAYSALLTTMPLDCLLRRLDDQPALAPLAGDFVHSSAHIVGVGLAGAPPPHLAGKCWMYFPEDSVPFYRVTVFSHYAPGNVPRPGEMWSLMCEVCETPMRPAPRGGAPEDVIAAVLEGLRAINFVGADARVLSTFHRRLEYGYPTPFLGRDALLTRVDAALKPLGIHSRGRFGAWKYEVANQDHSFMCVLLRAHWPLKIEWRPSPLPSSPHLPPTRLLPSHRSPKIYKQAGR